MSAYTRRETPCGYASVDSFDELYGIAQAKLMEQSDKLGVLHAMERIFNRSACVYFYAYMTLNN